MKKKGPLQGQHFKGFDFVKLLGDGAWSDVYLAVNSDKQQCAIKVIPKAKIKKTPKLNELIKTEIKVLKNCKNQNVIGYVDSFQTSQNIFIAMEYCNGGDLEQYLDKKKKVIQDEAVMFLKQILNGFKGLHQVGAMHRDFKVANILLHNSVCKIADLGFAKVLQKKGVTGTVLGTSLTMAPQVLDEEPYGMEADIWSVGVVFYQMIYGKYPYEGYSDFEILRKIKNQKIDFSKVSISQNARDFITRCMTIDPKKRISWTQIYDHPLIKDQKRGIIMGGLKSKICISENQQFYKQKKKLNEDSINKIPEVQMPQVDEDIRKSQNPAYLLEYIQKKGLVQDAIYKNERTYLCHRNSIMFIINFVEPYARQLNKIKANHEIALFILFKVAYLKLLAFLQHIEKKNNFLEIKQYWDIFVKSSVYEQLKNLIKEDIDMISACCLAYKQQIQSCSPKIRAEFKINVVQENFKGLVEEVLDEYWFLLAEQMLYIGGIQKQKLIKLLSALYFYMGTPYPNAQAFGNILMNINFAEAEQKIIVKVKNRMSNI